MIKILAGSGGDIIPPEIVQTLKTAAEAQIDEIISDVANQVKNFGEDIVNGAKTVSDIIDSAKFDGILTVFCCKNLLTNFRYPQSVCINSQQRKSGRYDASCFTSFNSGQYKADPTKEFT